MNALIQQFRVQVLATATCLLAVALTATAESPPAKSPPAETKTRERIGSVLGQDLFRDQLKENPPPYYEVVQLFMTPAMQEFERKLGAAVEMTDDEIRAGSSWMEGALKQQGGDAWKHWQTRSEEGRAKVEQRLSELQRQIEDPNTPEAQRSLLKTARRVIALEEKIPNAGEVWAVMRSRKLEQYLFDHYGGGRIIYQQLGTEALDARRKLLLELERQGKFEITDPALRKLAYDYWERPKHPGGFQTDRRLLEFPWTAAYQSAAQ